MSAPDELPTAAGCLHGALQALARAAAADDVELLNLAEQCSRAKGAAREALVRVQGMLIQCQEAQR